MCTVPNTYREEMDRQTSHPSCGFYAASYVLNCFNPDAAWTNMELLKLAVQYPLTNRAEGCLSEVGEVFHPHDFARFIRSMFALGLTLSTILALLYIYVGIDFRRK